MKKLSLLVISVLLIISGCRNSERSLGVDEIRFSEVDLLNADWAQVDFPVEPEDYFEQFFDKPIRSREVAINIATSILENEHERGRFLGFELRAIDHDPSENIWIFRYWMPSVLGSSFSVAMNGENGKVIALWVE